MLHKISAQVHVVVFDGASKNFGMAEKLGCNIKNLDGSFSHPSQTGDKVYVIVDICHMVKLARNAFSDMKSFCTSLDKKIS